MQGERGKSRGRRWQAVHARPRVWKHKTRTNIVQWFNNRAKFWSNSIILYFDCQSILRNFVTKPKIGNKMLISFNSFIPYFKNPRFGPLRVTWSQTRGSKFKILHQWTLWYKNDVNRLKGLRLGSFRESGCSDVSNPRSFRTLLREKHVVGSVMHLNHSKPVPKLSVKVVYIIILRYMIYFNTSINKQNCLFYSIWKFLRFVDRILRQRMKSRHSIEFLGIRYIAFTF